MLKEQNQIDYFYKIINIFTGSRAYILVRGLDGTDLSTLQVKPKSSEQNGILRELGKCTAPY